MKSSEAFEKDSLQSGGTVVPVVSRNEWYWNSPANIYWDNHVTPLGKGMSIDELVELFRGLEVDMIQVSARDGYATYPTKIGIPYPNLESYNTMVTWREVVRRLGVRFWVYIGVIDDPVADEHPEWGRVDAAGNRSRVCTRPRADGSGYLEAILIPAVREIIANYDPDGFWFDDDWQVPQVCYCPNCKDAWRQFSGKDEPPREPSDDAVALLGLTPSVGTQTSYLESEKFVATYAASCAYKCRQCRCFERISQISGCA